MIEYSAAGGVVIQNGLMLLLDRPKRREVRLPKGHIEPGEAPDVTALRETGEETGLAGLEIVADLGEQVVEFDYQGNHYRRTETYYLMRQVHDQTAARPPHDQEQFRPKWTPLAQAPALLTFPAEQEVARRAIAAYESLFGRDREANDKLKG
jgi:8-oxo-dGTP pyrophosphatase MutT (NUDIX family)